MTVSTTTSRIAYNGDGATLGPFSFPYYFLADADLKVYVGGVLKTLTTDYSVSGAGIPAGGSVTFVVAPPVGVGNVVIYRDPDLLQQTAYPPNDKFPSSSHERALDKLTMLVQRLSDRILRTLGLSDSDMASSVAAIPDAASRASMLLGFDATGNPIAVSSVAQSATQLALDLASTAVGKGTQLIGSQDVGNYFVGATAEAQLQEIGAALLDMNFSAISARSSNTILGADDNGEVIRATASFTQTLTAAATLGNGWRVGIMVDDTFALPIQPSGAETINGLSTVKVLGNGKVVLRCNGSAFFMDWIDDNANVAAVADSATPDWRRDVNGSKNISMDSGTTAITLPVLRNGENVTVKFGTARVLTNGASFPVIGGANRTTSSGDVSSFRGEASSVVREISADRAVGKPIASDYQLLSTFSPSNVASLAIPLTAGFTDFDLEYQLVPATNNAHARLQFSTDGGTTPLATNYLQQLVALYSGGSGASVSGVTTFIPISSTATTLMSNTAADGGVTGRLALRGFNTASTKARLTGDFIEYSSTDTQTVSGTLQGMRNVGANYNAVVLLFNTGNIASGSVKLYGRRTS